MDMVCITSTHAWNEFSASVILSIASNANDNTYCNENNSVVAQTQQSGLLTLLKLIDVYQSKSQNCRLIMNWIIIVRLPDNVFVILSKITQYGPLWIQTLVDSN